MSREYLDKLGGNVPSSFAKKLSLQFPSSFPQAQHCLWVMVDGSATLSCKRSKCAYARVQLTARRENSKHSLDPRKTWYFAPPRAFKLGGGVWERGMEMRRTLKASKLRECENINLFRHFIILYGRYSSLITC